jgi:hypothetical protein
MAFKNGKVLITKSHKKAKKRHRTQLGWVCPPLADCTRGFIPKTLPIAYPKEFKVIKSNRPRVQKQNFAHPTLVRMGKIFSRKSTKSEGS